MSFGLSELGDNQCNLTFAHFIVNNRLLKTEKGAWYCKQCNDLWGGHQPGELPDHLETKPKGEAKEEPIEAHEPDHSRERCIADWIMALIFFLLCLFWTNCPDSVRWLFWGLGITALFAGIYRLNMHHFKRNNPPNRPWHMSLQATIALAKPIPSSERGERIVSAHSIFVLTIFVGVFNAFPRLFNT